MRSEYSIRSEFQANKALVETFQAVKAVANMFNSKPQAKLNDKESMKAFQAKNGNTGKAIFTIA